MAWIYSSITSIFVCSYEIDFLKTDLNLKSIVLT